MSEARGGSHARDLEQMVTAVFIAKVQAGRYFNFNFNVTQTIGRKILITHAYVNAGNSTKNFGRRKQSPPQRPA